MGKHLTAGLLCLLLILFATSCSPHIAAPDGGASPAAARETPRTEGQLNLLACVNEDVVRAVVNRFMERTGYQVTYSCVPAIQAKELLLADSGQVDLFWGSTADAHRRLADAGLLLRQPGEQEGIARFYQDSSRNWTAVSVELLSIGVNLDTLRQELGEDANPPRTLEELTAPRYRGKLVLPDLHTSYSGTLLAASVLRAYGDQRGTQVLEELWGNAAEFAQTDLLAAQKVALGVYPITVCYYSDQLRMSQAGLPVQSQVYTVAGWTVAPVSVTLRGSNRVQAEAFRDFLISPEVQEMLGTLNQAISVREDTPAPEHLDVTILDFTVSSAARVNTSYFKDEQILELYAKTKAEHPWIVYADPRQPVP